MPKPKTDWTWFQQGEIESAIATCRHLLRAGILAGVYPPAVEQASLCWLLINLNDLLQKLDSIGHRLELKDDIHPSGGAQDVTHLINNARNAVCHLNSGHHLYQMNKFTFNVFRGYIPNGITIDGVVFGSNYADDTAVMFGANLVYLGRHVTAALEAAEAFFRASDFGGEPHAATLS